MKTSKLTRLIAFFLAAFCCVGTIVITGSASAETDSDPQVVEEEKEAASSISKMTEDLNAIS